MGWFDDLRDYYRLVGPLRFTIFLSGLIAIIVGYAAIGTWLMDKTGWPDAYGSVCHGRKCWLNYLYHSPKLLNTAHIFELLLFAWMWILPGATGAMIGIVLLRRWLKRRQQRIRPLDY